MCVAGVSKNAAIDKLTMHNYEYELVKWLYHSANANHYAYGCTGKL